MFLLVTVSQVAKGYNWDNIHQSTQLLLPRHKILFLGEIPLKYTIKRNAGGIEMIAASTVFNGVKSRFIYNSAKQICYIDFPKKNIRAWVLKNGNIILKPIFKEKEFNPSLVKGFSKLAILHVEGYLKAFDKEL